MSLYEDVANVANKEDAGVAARTHGMLLGEALADPGATAALGAGPDVQAHAFRLPDDHPVLMLWAYAAGADESAQAHLDLATDRSFDLHARDFSEAGSTTLLAPQGGVIVLDLTASPVILVEPWGAASVGPGSPTAGRCGAWSVAFADGSGSRRVRALDQLRGHRRAIALQGASCADLTLSRPRSSPRSCRWP